MIDAGDKAFGGDELRGGRYGAEVAEIGEQEGKEGKEGKKIPSPLPNPTQLASSQAAT